MSFSPLWLKSTWLPYSFSGVAQRLSSRWVAVWKIIQLRERRGGARLAERKGKELAPGRVAQESRTRVILHRNIYLSQVGMQTQDTAVGFNYGDCDLVGVSIRNPWVEYFTTFNCVTVSLRIFEVCSRGTSSKGRQFNHKHFFNFKLNNISANILQRTIWSESPRY